MKGRELPVICLEEVGPAREEAVRRFGEMVGRSSAQMLEAFTRFGEAARQTAASVMCLRRVDELAGWPAMHAFTPDLDLHCSVKGCGLGPEEHDLW